MAKDVQLDSLTDFDFALLPVAVAGFNTKNAIPQYLLEGALLPGTWCFQIAALESSVPFPIKGWLSTFHVGPSLLSTGGQPFCSGLYLWTPIRWHCITKSFYI